MDQFLVPEILNHVHQRGDGDRVRPALRNIEVLGPEADQQVGALRPVGRRASRGTGEVELGAAEHQILALGGLHGREVHGR